MSKSRSLSSLSAFAVFKGKSKKKKLREEVDNEEPELVEAVSHTKRRRYGEKLSDQEEIDEEQDETDSVPDVPIINTPIIIPRRPISVPCGNILAERVFKWMIDPLQPDKFFDQVFERKPVHIAKRNESPDYFKTVMSCKDFDNMMRENFLEYSKHIDVVIYTDGVRKTFNPEGRAYPSSVWKFYREGCSVRMQNPQSYHDNLWKLCSNLQEYFGSYVGANLYLTPPGSQGFAPHYDDIDAFILQLEGRKLWKIYPPRTNKEVLPRTSSVNFTQDEIGTPIMECELLPGDLLYFPRGFIHQARTADDVHSLHVTISTNQKNTFGDLLELALPRALEQAIKEDPEFRESLPKDYMNLVGTTNSNIESPERNKFLEKVISLSSKILKYLSVDEAADQHAKDFIHASMPPHLTLREKSRSIYGHGEEWENGRIVNVTELSPDSKIRLIRKRAARLVAEDKHLRIYHSMENSKVHKEYEAKYFDVEAEFVNAIDMLFHAYPEYIFIDDLPLNSLEEKNLALKKLEEKYAGKYGKCMEDVAFAQEMYNGGLLMTDEPLVPID